MKKTIVIAAFSMLLAACSSPDDSNATTETATSVQESTFQFNYVEPIKLTIDSSCLQVQANPNDTAGQNATVTCKNLGEASISPTVQVAILPKVRQKNLVGNDEEFYVYLEFAENGKKLDMPPYYFPSFADANSDWFDLDVTYINRNEIYVSGNSGHEGYPKHYYFDGVNWNTFSAWDFVRDVFPDEIQPPFSLAASGHILKITEENYCCDIAYTDSPARKAYRMVYILSRETGDIFQTSKISR